MLDVETISDRIEISDLLTRYTRAVDTGTWDLLDDVFTEDAHIDYTATGGIADEFPKVKAWLAEVLPMFSSRQHVLGQSEVSVEGDRAEVTAYFLNPMVLTQDDGTQQVWEFGGYYRHRLVRTPEGWRSCRLVEELAWKRQC